MSLKRAPCLLLRLGRNPKASGQVYFLCYCTSRLKSSAQVVTLRFLVYVGIEEGGEEEERNKHFEINPSASMKALKPAVVLNGCIQLFSSVLHFPNLGTTSAGIRSFTASFSFRIRYALFY